MLLCALFFICAGILEQTFLEGSDLFIPFCK